MIIKHLPEGDQEAWIVAQRRDEHNQEQHNQKWEEILTSVITRTTNCHLVGEFSTNT
jgi:hypothetical protein